jgi:hypothetical protein
MSLGDQPCGEYVGEPEVNDDQWCNRCGWAKADHRSLADST